MEKASFKFLSITAEAQGIGAIRIIAAVCGCGMITMIAIAAIFAFAK
jgi:hypothetical protein